MAALFSDDNVRFRDLPDLNIDGVKIEGRIVRYGGKDAVLTRAGMMILRRMIEAHWRIVFRLEIAAEVAKVSADPPDDNYLKVIISQMRRALRPIGITVWNERGIGYYLKKEKRDAEDRGRGQPARDKVPREA